MGRKPKFSNEIKIEACENYKMGKGSYQAIAKTIGCNESVLRRWYSTYINIGPSAFNHTKRNRSYRIRMLVTIRVS